MTRKIFIVTLFWLAIGRTAGQEGNVSIAQRKKEKQ